MVRWKLFWRNQKKSTKTELNELNEETKESIFMATGLDTGLKPTFGIKTAKYGSDNIEGFLSEAEKLSSGRLSNTDASNDQTRKTEKSTKSFRN